MEKWKQNMIKRWKDESTAKQKIESLELRNTLEQKV